MEKARIKKKKALEKDAAKYAKRDNFFTNMSFQFEKSNENEETGKAR